MRRRFVCCLLVLVSSSVLSALRDPAAAEVARVAVAANFAEAAAAIAERYEARSGDRILLASGSTGQLFTQIDQGAPFEAFLAADQARPARAEAEGLAVPGSRFTYATGRIVLFSPDPTLVEGPQTLRDGRFERLAIANPATAPYGTAAVEALRALGLYEGLAARIVKGNNIAQAYQFVESGNAELGFVALSQVIASHAGSRWVVPRDLYRPIAQDAVLLQAGAGNEAARGFLDYLKGPEAAAVLERFGYGGGG